MEMIFLLVTIMALLGAWKILATPPHVDHHITDGFVLTH